MIIWTVNAHTLNIYVDCFLVQEDTDFMICTLEDHEKVIAFSVHSVVMSARYLAHGKDVMMPTLIHHDKVEAFGCTPALIQPT